MTSTPLSDVVAQQYEAWVYPAPILDLESVPHRVSSDPSINHVLFWPDRPYPESMNILVAGCGANQAAMIAIHNPHARIVGIDVSEASLAHEAYLKERHTLDNLELRHLPIEEAGRLGAEFDLIACTGVLHHLADPVAGLRSLAPLLKPHGVVNLMLYGRYGQAGGDMVRALFRMLELKQDRPSLALAREALFRLPADHPARGLLAQVGDAEVDAGLVDLFLHRREKNYTVDECLDFVAQAGLVFQGWVDNHPYHPESFAAPGSRLYQSIDSLERQAVWSAMELVNAARLYLHTFVACRADRPTETYAINFDSDRFRSLIPTLRPGAQVSIRSKAPPQVTVTWQGREAAFAGDDAVLLATMDGQRTIGAILDAAAGRLSERPMMVASRARLCFRSLWRQGLIFPRLSPAG